MTLGTGNWVEMLRITSHSIYAVVGRLYTPGALAQQYIFGLKPPKNLCTYNTA